MFDSWFTSTQPKYSLRTDYWVVNSCIRIYSLTSPIKIPTTSVIRKKGEDITVPPLIYLFLLLRAYPFHFVTVNSSFRWVRNSNAFITRSIQRNVLEVNVLYALSNLEDVKDGDHENESYEDNHTYLMSISLKCRLHSFS